MREEGPGVGPFARESSDVPRLSFDPPFEILETTTRQALDIRPAAISGQHYGRGRILVVRVRPS